jgi:DNA-binding MarR family transcriptional regulator
MHLTHGASTGMVDRLIKLKLVDRVRSEEDRRVVYVSITDRGRELVERMRERRYSILKNIINSLDRRRAQALYQGQYLTQGKNWTPMWNKLVLTALTFLLAGPVPGPTGIGRPASGCAHAGPTG